MKLSASSIVTRCMQKLARTLVLTTLAACADAPTSPAVVAVPATLPSPPPIQPRVAVDDPACDAMRIPSPHGLLNIPDSVFWPAAAPMIHAVCTCTRHGESTHVSATFTPREGTVVAHAGMPDIDACLQNATISHYPPFELGSDCIDCGPRRYGIFRGEPPPEPPPSTSLTYSFEFVHPR